MDVDGRFRSGRSLWRSSRPAMTLYLSFSVASLRTWAASSSGSRRGFVVT